ncbi:hypothetical protein KAJ27_02185 [bacterium]|nr:hypothetical protein [bacterium]
MRHQVLSSKDRHAGPGRVLDLKFFIFLIINFLDVLVFREYYLLLPSRRIKPKYSFKLEKGFYKSLWLRISTLYNFISGHDRSCTYRSLFIYRIFYSCGYKPQLIYEIDNITRIMHARVEVKNGDQDIFIQHKIGRNSTVFSI